jgi:predicted acyl esterase
MDAIIGTGKISKREYEIKSELSVSIPMSDGITIDADIFRPDSDGKFPALLAIAPFDKELQSDRIWPAPTRTRRIRGSPDACLEAPSTDFYVRRGYVNIIASVRGTGKSGGVYQYLSARELKDTYEIIEWAAQQPWCNGNVGMVGLGYYSAHQPLVAEMQPPHLKAIAPIGTFWDSYRHFWWPGGVLQKGFLRWLVSLVNFDAHTEKSVLEEELGEEGYRQAIQRALADKDINGAPEIMEALKNYRETGNVNYLDILLHPQMSKYWMERGSNLDFSKIKVPAYLGAATHRPSVFYYYPDFKMPKKMIFFPPAYLDRPFYQFTWELLRFFDYWLKGIDTGIMDEPAVKIFIRSSNEWLMTNDFPVPGTRWIPFNLHENHSLCEIEPWPDALSASYDDNPENRGCLKYYSAPMVENTEVVGPIVANLYASCRGTDMILRASIWDVDPEGKETVLNNGWLRASHRELDTEKSKPWLPVHTHANPQPLVPGQIYEFSLDIWPIANLFKAGHRIMLKISSADDPPENLYQVGHEHLVSQTPNTITIYHDAKHPSHILLPVTKGNIIGTYVSGGDISLKNKEFMKLQ